MNKILSEVDYNIAIAKIDALMAKGSGNVSKDELDEIGMLAVAAQSYEQEKYGLSELK